MNERIKLRRNYLSTLTNIIEIEKRLPEDNSALYKWMKYRLSVNDEEVIKIVSKIDSNSDEDSNKWSKKFLEFKSFLQSNGRRPLLKNPEEKSMYKWMYNSLYSDNKYRSGLMKKLLDEYKDPKFMKGLSLLNDLKKFVEENNRLPQYSIENEKRLYIWAGKVRRNKFHQLYSEVSEIYKSTPKMRKRYIMRGGRKSKVYLDEVWEDRYEDLSKFISDKNRLPRYNIKRESSMYRWIKNTLSNKERPDRINKLNELLNRIEHEK